MKYPPCPKCNKPLTHITFIHHHTESKVTIIQTGSFRGELKIVPEPELEDEFICPKCGKTLFTTHIAALMFLRTYLPAQRI